MGVVENPATDGTRGTATIRFSERADVEPIARDVGAGIISRVSVGYRVSQWSASKDAQGNRIRTATRWTPAEISFTAIGADPGARTRSQESEETMNPTAVPIPDQIRSAAALLGVSGDFVENLAGRANVTIEAARTELLAHLTQSQPRVDGRSPVTVTRDADDQLFARAVNAVAHRVDGRVALREDARPWAGRRMADLGREFLRVAGASTLGGDDEILRRWGALHTTSDFGNFLAELFNKALLPAFAIAPSGLKLLARASSANDFRTKHVYRNSPMGRLSKVNEHGEFKRTTKADVKPENYSVQTFAAVFGITRQALVNDDVGVFADIASQLATQAAEFENEQLAALLVSNPTMSDGNALFSAAHANIATPGTIIDGTSLSAARLALRLQKNQNGQPIAVAPKYLLTSAAKESEGEKSLAAIYPATTENVNVFEAALQLVVDPRLDHLAVPLGWYLFADPSSVPVLEYSYLSGAEGPQVFTRSGFADGSDIDGTEVLCRLDYGCGAIGWQGAFKNPGA